MDEQVCDWLPANVVPNLHHQVEITEGCYFHSKRVCTAQREALRRTAEFLSGNETGFQLLEVGFADS